MGGNKGNLTLHGLSGQTTKPFSESLLNTPPNSVGIRGSSSFSFISHSYRAFRESFVTKRSRDLFDRLTQNGL